VYPNCLSILEVTPEWAYLCTLKSLKLIVRKRLVILFFPLLSLITVFGQAPILKEIHHKAAYPFLLYQPDSLQQGEKPPVIVFLHGRSLSGTDLNMVKRYGVLDAIKRGTKVPAIVIAPQVKKSESWEPDKVLSVLDYVLQNYETDTTRVYVVGMSLGGYGTLHFAGKYPHRIAAAVAMCGGGNPKDACNLGQTNIWIQHGKMDRAVPYTRSLEMFDAISSCNPQGECILTLFPKYGHGELAHEFYKDTLYNWLFQFQIGSKESAEPKKPVIEVAGVTNYPDSLIRENPIKSQSPVSSTPSSGSVHVVKQGDTLSAIARKYQTSVSKLCAINGIRETSILQLGQKIKVR
jgi:LysM repeat protein